MLVGDDGDADEAVDGDDGLEEDAGPASIDLLEAQILEVAHLRRVRHRATRTGVAFANSAPRDGSVQKPTTCIHKLYPTEDLSAQLEQPLAALRGWLQPTSAVAVDLDLLDGLVAAGDDGCRLVKPRAACASP